MAGAGYKLFNTGDVLTAAQVNTYLMEQTVMVFADAAARTTALSGVVSEGMISYLKDTNAVEVYDGSNWVSSDDPNAIQNTIVDAKGDLISASAADVPARLAVGNNGETLVADSSASTGLRWQETQASGKNRIINGAIDFDQRNSGASFTPTDGSYGVDRVRFRVSAASKLTAQQVTDGPSGISKSLKITSSAATTVNSGDFYAIEWNIEGFNVSDFALGTASAKTFTVSFWVKSSLTGTFGGAIANGAFNRSYPFTYSISSANTWERKSVVIAGDTSGTWLTDSGLGMKLNFGLGVGSTYSGTAGAWAGATNWSATGAISVVSTNAATWFLTGVQVEIGNVATAFSRAGGNIAGEYAACLRYFYKLGGDAAFNFYGTGYWALTTAATVVIPFLQKMRVAPSATISGNTTFYMNNGVNPSSVTLDIVTPNNAAFFVNSTGQTVGYATRLYDAGGNTSSISFSAEL